MPLTRDQILVNRPPPRREVVELPDLGGEVMIRELTLAEMTAIQSDRSAETQPIRIYPKLIAAACINEDGTPLFVGEDVKALNALPFPMLECLAKRIAVLSGITRDPEGFTGPKA